MDPIRLETVKKLDLQSGDILHIKVGGDLGDGNPPYLATDEDLFAVKGLWELVLPEGISAVYTHHLIDAEIIRHAYSRVNRWPPKQP